jgi:uncharacterized oxidoreductase
MKTADHNVLVTGGGSGIGLAIARRLAAGNNVVIAGRDEDRLARAAKEVPELRSVAMDVTDDRSIQAALDRVVRELGGLSLLVNNAGVLLPGSSRVEIETNLIGAVRTTELALPLVTAAAPDAAVVFISSAVAYTAVPGTPTYAATKAALTSYSRSVRKAIAPGVKVFSVHPPLVDTEAVAALGGAKIPPADVADATLAALERDRYEVGVGQARHLRTLGRALPRLADRIVERGLAA